MSAFMKGIMIFIILIVAVGCGIIMLTSGGESSTKDLNAEILFDGLKFTITNNDDFDWYNVEFTLNESYILHADVIKANTTYTVGAAQFAKKDGTRFNPFTQKALNISIWCDLKGGKNGHWYGEWK